MEFELPQIVSFRGSKSRNKVSVGEPADGSLHFYICGFEPRACYACRFATITSCLFDTTDTVRCCVGCVCVWGRDTPRIRIHTRAYIHTDVAVPPFNTKNIPLITTQPQHNQQSTGYNLTLFTAIAAQPPRPRKSKQNLYIRLLTTDILVLATMKNAAKCDT